MERKTISIEVMFLTLVLGVVSQKIDNPEMVAIWFLLGLFIGLIESTQHMGNVFVEVPIACIIFVFLGVIFELVLGYQIFVSTPESDHFVYYMMVLYQSLLIGTFTLVGAAFPVLVRKDKAEKHDASKEESTNNN